MKTILIATDFSQASRNAAVYGLELAKAFNAKVVLVNSYQAIPVMVTEVPLFVSPEDIRGIARDQLAQEEKIINAGARAAIETVCREGAPADTLLEIAKEKNADLIIAGMKEGGRGIRKLLGSTVTALARKSRIPLIIVPEKVKYTGFSNIVLANEGDLDPDANRHLLDSLRSIAARFHSKLYLVRVADSRVQAAYETFNRPFRLIRLMRTLDPSYGVIEGQSVAEGLNHFIEGYQINMLAMLPHKHSLLERWFIKSTTLSIVFEIHIPLLILPDLHIEGAGS